MTTFQQELTNLWQKNSFKMTLLVAFIGGYFLGYMYV
jgi:hypothetical protein